MKVLLIEPGKRPQEAEIDPGLHSMQSVVGGPIQAVYPFREAVALICHEEGKILGLLLNRALFDLETEVLYDIIAGTFFLCAAPPDSDCFTSLSDQQIKTYTTRFQYPEQFFKLGEKIVRIPIMESRADTLNLILNEIKYILYP